MCFMFVLILALSMVLGFVSLSVSLFVSYIWVFFCCDVVWGGVIFVLSVMCVVGGVPLWVECVFFCLVCCVCCTQLLF